MFLEARLPLTYLNLDVNFTAATLERRRVTCAKLVGGTGSGHGTGINHWWASSGEFGIDDVRVVNSNGRFTSDC